MAEAEVPEPALRGTPIRDYDPDLTAEDYAVLARVRDEIRSRGAEGS